ncbi:competence protein CoiA family protein [Solibacillus sp. CAU 1738]|uniref:competence protein CoiA n=1 Tax=Solibacillus sp. CAU 1738 TaxID=3140363 RepID=UPI0032604F28
MLVARTMNGELLILTADLCPNELSELRKRTSFFCPQCQSKLQLKIGRVKIPHFAHLQTNFCDTTFSEGESATHLQGKQQLFTFFSKRTDAVALESYIPQLKQRPDLLVTHQNKQYAVEFQCSRIPTTQIHERSAGYKNFQITPLWLVKTPHQFRKQGISKISLNEFYQQFIAHYQNDRYLLTYNSEKRVFTYFSNLHYVQGSMWLGKVQTLPIERQQFPFFVPKRLTEKEYNLLWITYKIHRENFLKSRILLSRSGVNDVFLRGIYELRLSREALPHFIGIPILGSEAIPLFSAEWQLNLFYFLHITNMKLTQISDQVIHAFLMWNNLSETNNAQRLISRYVAFLKKIGVKYIHTEIDENSIFNQLYGEYIAFLQDN